MPVENDCEDQGFTRIEDGCYNWKCATWRPLAEVADRPKLVIQEYPAGSGKYWWNCPKCGGSYGEAPKPNATTN